MAGTSIIDRKLALGIIVVGIIVLIIGLVLLFALQYASLHPLRGYAVVIVGIVLAIIGIVGLTVKKGSN
ncbi:MAG TPA: hypothetical protein VHZ51_07715 [Ktedonobacteraceae bacterium]|jgi:hypothetical protein|nr:hypothetical protein [Ktedonobacteraceae bacterium]